MNKLLLILISILLAVGGCDIFKDEKSESKTTSKTEVKQESDNESQASELSKKEEELKKKELELKEEELRIKEEQLQKKKKSEKTSYYGVPGDYPEGSTRYLTYSDIAGKSKWELSVMRNEIIARHGYIFRRNMAIRDHFMRQSWYEPRYYNVEHLLTDIERYNVEFIKSFE